MAANQPGDLGGIEARRLNDLMVDRLVADGVIRQEPVERAFRSVLRHWFLPNVPWHEVYSGRAIPTRFDAHGPTSSSSEPAIMAQMLQQLDLQPGQTTLEVGAGTGYNAALLAALVGGEGSVVTVDIDTHVTAEATAHLVAAGVANTSVVTGDGWAGVPDRGPFDRIEATVGVWDLSPSWADQLRPGGVLVAPLWLRCGLQASVAFEKDDDSMQGRSVMPCGFMRLRGAGAGPEVYRRIGRWTATLDWADEDA